MTSDYSIGAAFFYFFIIVLINSLIGRKNKNFSLTGEELVIIFGMMAVSCAIPTWGFALNLIPLLPGVYYYAEPGWKEKIIPFINKKITVCDEKAIEWFFEGLPKGYKIPWNAWIGPLSLWFLLIFSIYLLSILIAYFLTRRWFEEERLLYPLNYPAEELSKNEILKDKLFYTGILIPFIILSIYCLGVYFPQFPQISLSRTYSIFRRTTGINVRIAFEVIGFIYFVSLDVSLSLWLFFLLFTIQKGFFNITGFGKITPEPWAFSGIEAGYQCMGAMFIMVLIMLWQERHYLRGIVKEKGNIKYLVVWLLCFLITVFWLNFSGLKFIHSFIFVIFLILTYIGLTRVVCQSGTPYARSGVTPAGMVINLFGSKRIGETGLTSLGFTSPYGCDLRTLVMTSSANFFALSGKFKINLNKVIIASVIAVIIGIFSSFYSIISTAYKYGGINLGGWQFTSYVPYTIKWVKEYILYIDKYGFGKYEYSFFTLGAFLYLILHFLRLRFPGFPIHPIGLTVSATIPIYFTWFSIFIGWLLKFLILKYGGQKLYKKLQPFFIGIIIGAFLTAGIWMIIDFITGKIPATHPVLGA